MELINIDSAFASQTKHKFNTARNIITFLIGTSICLSVVYFFYWIAVLSEDYILTYTEQIFSPLASLLSPADKSIEMYKTTSYILFLSTIPMGIVSYILDKIQDVIIEKHNIAMEKKEKQLRLQAYKNNLKQYDEIRSYSICLSLDYKAKRDLNSSTKETLNKIIYAKFKDVLKNTISDVNINASDVLIITSNNFNKFDYVYDTTLKVLAKIKNYAEEKYDLELIPSITTDAYIKNVEAEKIKKNHFEIQSFNLKNRACSTGLFSKKYQHMKKNKYAGVPIGEYASIDKNKPETYELNVIYKNLTQTLASYK